jgi:hypothetical protein
MAAYIVIALSVGGHSNKIFNAGDEVTEADFQPGEAEILVEKGFLAEGDTPPEARKKAKEKEKEKGKPDHEEKPENVIERPNQDLPEHHGLSTADDKNFPELQPPPQDFPELDDPKLTKADIIKALKEKGIDYDVNSSKQDLYNLLYKK